MNFLESLRRDNKPEVVKIETPEWPEIGRVYVRSGTADRRDAMESRVMDSGATRIGFRAFVAAYFLCDAEGNYSFAEEQIPEAVQVLGASDSRPMQRIFNAATKLNALTKSDEEELVKN